MSRTQKNAAAVLGIDAAWTEAKPSGVALIERAAGRWQCVDVQWSYGNFLGANAAETNWPGAAALVAASNCVAGGNLTVVAADIPLSLRPIVGRRTADQAVSTAFGSAKCSTHTPSAVRPGKLADQMRQDFAAEGYELATKATPVGTSRCLIEVYPHPALLTLCTRKERLPYKAGKRARYWKDKTPAERLDLLFAEWLVILEALRERIDGITLDLPAETMGTELKRFEDMLDALICAWVGAEYLDGRARPYGDDEAAIWVPTSAEIEAPRRAQYERGAK